MNRLSRFFSRRHSTPARRRKDHACFAPAAEVLEERILLAVNPLTEELIGFHEGEWWISTTTELLIDPTTTLMSFTTEQVDQWANVDWQALNSGDFDGDGRTDVIGLYRGEWYVGLARDSGFSTALWDRWADVDWQDVTIGDYNGDGRDDVIARNGGQWWGSTSSDAAFDPSKLLATWANVDYDKVFLTNVDDGLLLNLLPLTPDADLVGFIDGDWYVSTWTGTAFSAPKLWADWANVAWDEIMMGDFDLDGRGDAVGFINGDWYVGGSTGSGFKTRLWADWAAAEYDDPRIGDFDGDLLDDVTARFHGEWYVGRTVGLTVPTALVLTSRWATWADVDWQDVQVGDFDGDLIDDVAGRIGRDWYVGRSIALAFVTGSRWASWSHLDWDYVTAGRYDVGLPVVPSLNSSSDSGLLLDLLPDQAVNTLELLSLFQVGEDDDDILASLLASLL